MEAFNETIRKLRENQKLPLRKVAAFLDIDQAILSKMERGIRKPNRAQVKQLAAFFGVPERELLIQWMAQQIIYTLEDEELALEALHAAEEMVEWKRSPSATADPPKLQN